VGILQTFLKEAIPFFWRNVGILSDSPDLNPLDYCLWGVLKDSLKNYGSDRLSNIPKQKWQATSAASKGGKRFRKGASRQFFSGHASF
jgi:hypothetical protein